mgnify:CR=1 FL=1
MQNIPTPTDKRGIFADNLASPFLADINHAHFNGTFDFVARSFSLPRTDGQAAPTIANGSNCELNDDIWLLDYTESSEITQMYSSLAKTINAYERVNTTAKIKMTPAAKISLQTTQSVQGAGVEDQELVRANVQNALTLAHAQINAPVSALLQNQYSAESNQILEQVPVEALEAFDPSASSTQLTTQNSVSNVVTTIQVNISHTVAHDTLTIEGFGFRANDRAIMVDFDGIPCPLTPVAPTTADPNSSAFGGTVIADSQGYWKATFVIPPNIKPGVHVISSYAHDEDDLETATSLASTNYLISAFLEDIQTTVTHILPPVTKLPALCKNVVGIFYANAHWGANIKGLPTERGLAAATGPISRFLAILFADQGAKGALPVLVGTVSYPAIGASFSHSKLWASIKAGMGGTYPGVGSMRIAAGVAKACLDNPQDIEGNIARIEAFWPKSKTMTLCSIAAPYQDPLAQTFSFNFDKFLTSIELYFSIKPVSEDCRIVLVPTELGIPDTSRPIAMAIKAAADITINTATKFTFDKPVFLRADTIYAFVVMTDDTLAAVYTAVLGQKDQNTDELIVQNPGAGAMLVSPNNETWELLAGHQLKMKINVASFSNTEGVLNLGNIEFDQPSSRMALHCPFSLPSKDCSVQFQYSMNNSEWQDFPPLVEIDFGNAIEEVWLRIKLKGTNELSPVVTDFANLLYYIWNLSGAYVHRQFSLPDEDGLFVEMYVDTRLPGNTEITPKVTFNGTDWNTMSEVPGDAQQIDDQWVQRHYIWDNGATEFQDVRTKIEMETTANYQTPSVKKVRVIAR